MTIDSAKRFAILTSFNVNPTKDHEPGHVSATTFAMLESLAKKQHDSYFKFVFLYNDNKLQRNALVSAIVGQNVTANMSLKSKSQIPGTITWPAVVESYNRQQCVEELRIGHVKCGIYFVAAKAKGAAGSHHNKFCINDQGVAATMGASIANKTKGGWMDGGCIAISAELASSQRHYFLDELIGGHAVQCAQLQMDGGTPSMAPVQDLTALQALADIEVRSPLDMGVPGAEATLARFQNALNGAGVLLKGGRHKVLWVQNPSDGYKNMFSTGGHIEGKPIGRAIASIFRSAVAGESIDIVGKKIGTEALAMIKEALSKGCHVNVLVDHSSRSWVEYAARHFYAEKTAKSRGSLTVRHYEPSARLAREHHLDTEHEQVLHAKNYVLTRNDGSYVLMTGSYNLDGQSHYRSNENLMVFESTDADLRKSLFDDLYYGSNSTISHYPAQAAHRRSGVRPMAS
ncbi:hypothetical protein AVKW3434_17920 [Acidovorax sp. SUPP3434]|uniref:phospholipase D-like domain-containing protein n=1 Tax=Acidovorax sp. SUPP3434 TaxID=2920880 RepID=UPI0023DE4E22|nr:phospholipase D-like domain-containing protein [Acidovorax sp. SUPP3434]GKT01295.1 hypothetical protein AVKW3434_17920 [Acidovorax sp. SUPP3434]